MPWKTSGRKKAQDRSLNEKELIIGSDLWHYHYVNTAGSTLDTMLSHYVKSKKYMHV